MRPGDAIFFPKGAEEAAPTCSSRVRFLDDTTSAEPEASIGSETSAMLTGAMSATVGALRALGVDQIVLVYTCHFDHSVFLSGPAGSDAASLGSSQWSTLGQLCEKS